MLIIISPAKTLDYETPPKTRRFTLPDFLDESERLINLLRINSVLDLAELMKLSIKLAELNFERYRDWHRPFTPDNAKQAILAMKGDVYTGLDPGSFKARDFAFAQKHLRVLSGLYGVLRPLDLMQPYRLEMGTRLSNDAGRDLYAFWGETITDALNKTLKAQGDDLLINLASNEYFKAVKPKRVEGRIITPTFKEYKNGSYRIIGIFAKKARGLMSAYVVKNRVTDPQRLKLFDGGGYRYHAALSDERAWTFTRDGPG